MGRDILLFYIYIYFPDRAAGKEQCALACTLRVVTMELCLGYSGLA